MTFAVHTEKQNLISIVAAEHQDEVHDAKVHVQQQKQQLNAVVLADTAVNPHKNVRSYESRRYEMISLFQLAIPTFIIQLGSIIPGFAIASYIGQSYTTDIIYLDGYTLASLTANLFTLSLLQGLYTASDTLSPQAYGAGNMKEVGYLAVRGYLASMVVVLPITVTLVFYMKPMLLWIGEDSDSVAHACSWFNIYAGAIPFYALYQVTTKFLSAQNQMQPLVVCCLLSTCIVLPISLYTLGSMYGYIGTAIAIVIYQIFQSLSLIVYIWIFQPHDPSTWPGLYDGIKNAILLEPFLSYMALGAGGMLASSEWIYWETLSLMIGTFGIVPLSVHTIPTQLIMMTFIGPYSLGLALSIRLGATIPVLVSRAQQTVIDTFIFSIIVFGATAILMYIQQDWLISLFTKSHAVVDGCHEIWWKVSTYSFCLSIYGIYMGTCVGLGMQWTLGIGTFIALWILGLPSGYYLAVVKDGGINVAWSTVWPPYIILPIALTIAIVRADWNDIAREIRQREGVELIESRRPSFLTPSARNNVTNNAMQHQSLLHPSKDDEQHYGSIQ